ncbi:MAG TPA: DinB family protein [Patescibacteria group bacterium]|nr:DinB family protein [Patescibacteria group bacterium]
MELHRHLTRLVRYNGWANSRVLEQALKVLPETPVYGRRYGEVAGELLHILEAEEFWLASWRGTRAEATPDPDKAQLAAAFASVQAELEGFMAGLDEGDLAATFTRVGRHETISAPLGDLIAHLVGHNTFHRGGIAVLLTNAGFSPGDIDLYDFILRDGGGVPR